MQAVRTTHLACPGPLTSWMLASVLGATSLIAAGQTSGAIPEPTGRPTVSTMECSGDGRSRAECELKKALADLHEEDRKQTPHKHRPKHSAHRSGQPAKAQGARSQKAGATASPPGATSSLPASSVPRAETAASNYCWAPTQLAPIQQRPAYCDSTGLLVHIDDDGTPTGKFNGGDTAQREGWYWLGVWLRSHTVGLTPWTHARLLTFDQVIAKLEPNRNGVFYRHPTLPPWNSPYDKDWGTSRDQLVPLIAAMGVYGKQAELRRLWEALPDDIQGRHAFNGNWRNFLGQDGMDCTAIKKRGCDATSSCPADESTKPCTRESYQKNCSLVEDKKDCSLQEDTTSCPEVCTLRNIFTGGCSVHGHDVTCEARKGVNNTLNAAKKSICESTKATNNAANVVAKLACESGKTSQQGTFDADKANCEAGKAGQNTIFAIKKAGCEAGKTGNKYLCEADKKVASELCQATNIFNGDLIGPATTNLFRRARGFDPSLPSPDDMLNTNVIYAGAGGEAELFADSQILDGKSRGNKDFADTDLNHIVHLVLSELRYPTAGSKAAVATYVAGRGESYGSFLGAYYAAYGNNTDDETGRIVRGIASGWKPDVSEDYGAVRWYHRPTSSLTISSGIGANPALSELWAPIIAHYLKKGR